MSYTLSTFVISFFKIHIYDFSRLRYRRAQMFSEVDYDAILVDPDVEWNTSTGMEDRVEAQALFVGEVVGFDIGCKMIGTVRTVVKIEIDDA